MVKFKEDKFILSLKRLIKRTILVQGWLCADFWKIHAFSKIKNDVSISTEVKWGSLKLLLNFQKKYSTSPGNVVYEWTFNGKGWCFNSWDIKKLAKIRKWAAENGHTLSWRWIRWTEWHKRHFFHLCFYSSLAKETYHIGITIQWFCRLDILTQTHKHTSTNSSLFLSRCCLDFYIDHTMHCCSVPSWGDDRWLPGQINSAVSNSKNNTLTQIRAHLVSCCWVHAQAQSHCLYCPFHTRACRDTYMGSGAMQPPAVTFLTLFS